MGSEQVVGAEQLATASVEHGGHEGREIGFDQIGVSGCTGRSSAETTPVRTRPKRYPSVAAKEPVGLGAIADHDPVGAQTIAHEGGDRLVRLAGHHRLDPRRRGHRRHQ